MSLHKSKFKRDSQFLVQDSNQVKLMIRSSDVRLAEGVRFMTLGTPLKNGANNHYTLA